MPWISRCRCFSRCWVGQRGTQDFCWYNYMPGCDCWELHRCWYCLLCQWVEDADSGSHVTPCAVCHRLEVGHHFHLKALRNDVCVCVCVLKPAHCCFRWLPESARWLLANGKADAAHRYIVKCAEINNRSKCLETVTPKVYFSVVCIILWDCWKMMVGGFFFLADVTGICRNSVHR